MSTLFSAKEPALGYYYQIIRGLVLLLGENRMDSPVLSFECLDDIVIEDKNEVDLYQAKLHITKANITDRSTDFWKTIRVWSEGIKDGIIDPNKTVFTLITTATVSEGSFIMLFKSESNENRQTVLNAMDTIATETDNETNMKGYQAFSTLTEEQKKALIKNIRIADADLSVDETKQELKKILEVTAPSTALDDFVNSIMGWWFFRSIDMLNTSGTTTISRDAVINQIQALRDQIRADALPEDYYVAVEVSEEELAGSESKTYVKQLSLVDATKREKRFAISDYKRAYGQRSKWLRDGRVSQNEYDIFDSNLQDDWNSRFGIIEDDTEGKTDEEKKEAGHAFYRDFYVDPKHNMPSFKNKGAYITKGSYQMLSDSGNVGWHPDYKTLLENDETVE